MCCCKINEKALKRIIMAITIVSAIALAIIVSVWNNPQNLFRFYLSQVFSVIAPVLVIGALLKYLVSDISQEHDKKDHCSK